MFNERMELMVVTQSGPTYDDQVPFVWSESPFAKISHAGQPDTWNFPWVTLNATNFKSTIRESGSRIIG